jgi:hypothetical protein
MWPSLSTAETIYDLANIGLIFAAVIGVTSTIFVVWMGNKKETYLKREIAELTKSASEANAEALKAQLALEKYKAPRILSSEQREFLIFTLKLFDGQKYALSVATGSEPENLVCELDGVLQAASWHRVGPFGTLNTTTWCGKVGFNTSSGVRIRAKLGSASETLQRMGAVVSALNDDGILAVAEQDPDNIPEMDVIVIMVGTKP